MSDPIKEAHKERLLKKKKRIGRGIWIPSNGEKSELTFFSIFPIESFRSQWGW